jgi:hypothetical protein
MVVPPEELIASVSESEMNRVLALQAAERLESVKAALFSAVAVAATFVLLTTFNQWIATAIPTLWMLQMQGLNWQGLGSGAIALLAGFVFGITYRYAVRSDNNPHLGSGVVMAFGSVRGLAQLDVGLMAQGIIWPFVVLAAESVFLFAIARLVLDLVLQLGWVRCSVLEKV